MLHKLTPILFCFLLHCLRLVWLFEHSDVLMQVWNKVLFWCVFHYCDDGVLLRCSFPNILGLDYKVVNSFVHGGLLCTIRTVWKNQMLTCCLLLCEVKRWLQWVHCCLHQWFKSMLQLARLSSMKGLLRMPWNVMVCQGNMGCNWYVFSNCLEFNLYEFGTWWILIHVYMMQGHWLVELDMVVSQSPSV